MKFPRTLWQMKNCQTEASTESWAPFILSMIHYLATGTPEQPHPKKKPLSCCFQWTGLRMLLRMPICLLPKAYSWRGKQWQFFMICSCHTWYGKDEFDFFGISSDAVVSFPEFPMCLFEFFPSTQLHPFFEPGMKFFSRQFYLLS